MEWKIYYEEGRTAGGDGLVGLTAAPSRGVMAVVQPCVSVGREVLHYFDYYLFRTDLDAWVGVYGEASLVDQIVDHAHNIAKVLVGRMTTKQEWDAVFRMARNDPSFPTKGGNHPFEEPRR